MKTKISKRINQYHFHDLLTNVGNFKETQTIYENYFTTWKELYLHNKYCQLCTIILFSRFWSITRSRNSYKKMRSSSLKRNTTKCYNINIVLRRCHHYDVWQHSWLFFKLPRVFMFISKSSWMLYQRHQKTQVCVNFRDISIALYLYN